MSFLSNVTNTILQNEKIEFENSVIIIPNRRAKKVLQKKLAEKIAKISFLPQIYTISEFIELLSPLKKIENNQLLLLFYQDYKKREPQDKINFISFVSWASLFLTDINEIDLQLLDADKVFVNLSNIKDIEISLFNEKLTENQERYLKFYNKLKDYYSNLISKLKDEKRGYEGMIYRDVATYIDNYASKLTFKNYFFVGFNALSAAEIKIINYFQENYNTHLLFDLDSFYYDEKKQTFISHFISKMLKELNATENIQIGNDFSNIKKEIFITGVAKQINQVMYAVSVLQKLSEEELNRTALVLVDENLLLPFVHSYDCSNANLTMGYPFQATPEYHLLEAILNLVKNGERYKTKNEEKKLFYHKDIAAFYQNPIIINCFFNEKNWNNSYNFIQKEIIERNKVFFEFNDIPKNDIAFIPNLEKNGAELFQEILSFFKKIQETFSQKSFFLDIIIKGLEKIEELLSIYLNANEIDYQVVDYFITNYFQGKTIDTQGNPEQGLQIMGMLETRVLDFDNVIMLSVNEGILPKGKTHNSLLLFDIKKYFGLPTFREKDAIYAYHFFRLLQRAKNVHLIYNYDSSDSLAEKSRFISQLEFEVKAQQLENTIKIYKNKISLLPHQNTYNEPLTVKKDDRIIEKLKNMRYSPSRLITYINCPLQFYLKYVEKIEIAQEVTEDVDRSVIGNVIHEILEELVKEIIKDKKNTLTILNEYKTNLETKLIDVFLQEKIAKNELEKGKFYLAFQVVEKYLSNYFSQLEDELEKQSIPDFIGAETELKTEVEVDNYTFDFFGKVDRIDKNDNKIVILDYKTGFVESKQLVVQLNLDDVFTNSDFKQPFQLLSYIFLYHFDKMKQKIDQPISYQCGIVSFRSLMKNPKEYIHFLSIKNEENEVSYEINLDIIDLYGEQLKQLLSTIINIDNNFEMTANSKNCSFCDYKLLCNR